MWAFLDSCLINHELITIEYDIDFKLKAYKDENQSDNQLCTAKQQEIANAQT